MSKLDINGKGFDKSPLSEEELAQHRHRAHHYDENFLNADDFLAATGLTWAASIAKGAPAFIKFALVAGSLAGAMVAMTKAGWI